MIKVGDTVDLIKSVNLIQVGKNPISVDKEHPCRGVVISRFYKKIAGKQVLMFKFRPNKIKDGSYSFGSKAFKEIEQTGGQTYETNSALTI